MIEVEPACCAPQETQAAMTRMVIAAAILLAWVPAHAEIVKRANTCESGVCLHWWPKLPSVEGWHQELQASDANGMDIFAPDGFTFSNAQTVIYAKAPYKPRIPATKSLDDLIEGDKRDFRAEGANVVIADAPAIATGDGQKLRSLTYSPSGQGNWERVAYGEEGDFYLIFVISSRSESGLKASMPVFEAVLSKYKK